MRTTLGKQRYHSGTAAKQLWEEMNIELLKFREATSYTGKAREWQAYKEALRSISNQEPYKSAEAAEGQLGHFLADTMESGQWPQDARAFAEQLAEFMALCWRGLA
jgi:hypothetical protein